MPIVTSLGEEYREINSEKKQFKIEYFFHMI